MPRILNDFRIRHIEAGNVREVLVEICMGAFCHVGTRDIAATAAKETDLIVRVGALKARNHHVIMDRDCSFDAFHRFWFHNLAVVVKVNELHGIHEIKA